MHQNTTIHHSRLLIILCCRHHPCHPFHHNSIRSNRVECSTTWHLSSCFNCLTALSSLTILLRGSMQTRSRDVFCGKQVVERYQIHSLNWFMRLAHQVKSLITSLSSSSGFKGTMKPNLMKQETQSLACIFRILFKLYTQPLNHSKAIDDKQLPENEEGMNQTEGSVSIDEVSPCLSPEELNKKVEDKLILWVDSLILSADGAKGTFSFY